MEFERWCSEAERSAMETLHHTVVTRAAQLEAQTGVRITVSSPSEALLFAADTESVSKNCSRSKRAERVAGRRDGAPLGGDERLRFLLLSLANAQVYVYSSRRTASSPYVHIATNHTSSARFPALVSVPGCLRAPRCRRAHRARRSARRRAQTGELRLDRAPRLRPAHRRGTEPQAGRLARLIARREAVETRRSRAGGLDTRFGFANRFLPLGGDRCHELDDLVGRRAVGDRPARSSNDRPALKPMRWNRAAELLAEGKIIGWFQGGSEFGPESARPAKHTMRSAAGGNQGGCTERSRQIARVVPSVCTFAPAILLEEDLKLVRS